MRIKWQPIIRKIERHSWNLTIDVIAFTWIQPFGKNKRVKSIVYLEYFAVNASSIYLCVSNAWLFCCVDILTTQKLMHLSARYDAVQANTLLHIYIYTEIICMKCRMSNIFKDIDEIRIWIPWAADYNKKIFIQFATFLNIEGDDHKTFIKPKRRIWRRSIPKTKDVAPARKKTTTTRNKTKTIKKGEKMRRTNENFKETNGF